MNERDKLIQKLIEEKGGSREDYLTLLNAIAYHESAGTLDPTLKQYGGGPGRGKYQFEEGKHAGGITAAKRTAKYYADKGIKMPEWLKEISKNDNLDVTNLSSEQQDILFLGNMRQHPKADLGKVVKGEEDITDFWANYHWAGNKEDRKERVKSFNDSLSDFNSKKKIKQPINYQENTPIINNKIEVNEQSISAFDDSKLDFKPIPNFMDYLNTAALGGMFNSSNQDKNLNEFNGGGTHFENPLGGIPQGIGNNGKQNTVEEDETSFELKNGKYVFSNRLTI
jgi:hypothetical protein